MAPGGGGRDDRDWALKRKCEEDIAPVDQADFASNNVDQEVSDGELVNSVNSDEVDNLLGHSDDELGEPNDKDNEVILANRQCNVSVDTILAREFGGEEPKPSLPPVSAGLTKVVNEWMHNTPKREKIKELFKETFLPENVDSLLLVKINEIVYQRLPFKAKVNDQRLRGINTFFVWDIGPLVSVLDRVINFESACDSDSVPVSLGKGVLKVNGVELDVTSLRILLSQALKLLAVGNSVVLLKQKGNLKPYLDGKFHYLLKPTNPMSNELLGPELEQKITDGTWVMDVAKKLAASLCPNQFRPRFNTSRQPQGNN